MFGQLRHAQGYFKFKILKKWKGLKNEYLKICIILPFISKNTHRNKNSKLYVFVKPPKWATQILSQAKENYKTPY